MEKASGPLKQRIQSQTAREIRAALEKTGGNKRQAAGLLGISRGHLHRLMTKLLIPIKQGNNTGHERIPQELDGDQAKPRTTAICLSLVG